MTDSRTDHISFKAPRHVVALATSLFLGGGIGAGAVGLTHGRTADAAPMPWLTRAEVEKVATDAEARARAHADAVGAGVRDDCRRELAQNVAALIETLRRIEIRLDRVEQKVDLLSLEVAALKARKRG